MSDLASVAKQLRQVRMAEERFLGLWAVEQAIILPALDRVAADIHRVGHGSAWGSAGSIDGGGEPPLDE